MKATALLPFLTCQVLGFAGSVYAFQQEDCLYCHIREISILYIGAYNRDAYECILDSADNSDGNVYRIDLPQDFLWAHQEAIDAGTTVCIAGGIAITNPNHIVIPESEAVYIAGERQTRQRVLAPTTGTNYALAVRVKSSRYDQEPSASVAELQGRVFGKGPEKESVNIASQFELCSKGKFRIRPTTTGQGVEDGVIEIDVDIQFDDVDIDSIRQELIDTVETATGVSIDVYEHILFCVPIGSTMDGDSSWAAFAILGGQLTFYNGFCDGVSILMHELGHNLRFRHSHENGLYEDKSGFMGFSYNVIGRPAMCFNGHKLYQSGWFAETSRVVNPTSDGEFRGRLVSFVDHNIWPDDGAHIIKVEHYYAVYNRAKLYNRQTQEKQNLVTLVQNLGASSEMLGGIPEGDVLCAGIYCFEVCEYAVQDGVDFANICIYDQTQQEMCCKTPTPTDRPTLGPSPFPSSASTDQPTSTPTMDPTSGPTLPRLTEAPSVSPTATTSASPTGPQSPPTGAPSSTTDIPTSLPTRTPSTEKPTAKPTKTPTVDPTVPSTEKPTIRPTKEPTVAPTGRPTKNPTRSPTTRRPTTVPPTPFPSPRTTRKPNSFDGLETIPPTAPPTTPTTGLQRRALETWFFCRDDLGALVRIQEGKHELYQNCAWIERHRPELCSSNPAVARKCPLTCGLC